MYLKPVVSYDNHAYSFSRLSVQLTSIIRNILGQYTLYVSMAYCSHRQNLVSTDDDGHCMSDMNVRMRKLLTITNEKMSWSSVCFLLNNEFMKIIGDQ